jgi:hypothetical protein
MKICPRCQKTYTDDNLNFCLDDGVVLQQAGSTEPPATVFMNQPRPTDPSPRTPITTGQPATQQPAWNTAPQQYGGPQKKSSKTWIWVLLILGLVVLVCGGGLVGMFAYIATKDSGTVANTTTNTKGNTSNTKITLPTNNTTGNTSTTNTSTTTPSDGRTNVQDIDLQDWVRDTSLYGNTEFTNGEFIMSSKQKGYYYVLVAPDDYTTDNADVRVTLRNMDNMDSRYGYGLIFHSNPTPLNQDYAFLIDTKKKKYRVVRHEPSDEKTVVAWTNSNAIKDGTQENTLEIRDKGSDSKVELYINGQLVNSIPNTYGYKGGVPGLYAGDAAKIAFKNLQVVK